MNGLFVPFKKSKTLNTLFVANIFISFHYALILYINSSFLSNFFTDGQVSALYIIGSILETILLLNASKILEKLGDYKFLIYVATIEALATLGLAVSSVPTLDAIFFLAHILAISMIAFNMDVFVESASKDENMTGEIRAAYLTMSAIVFVLAQLVVAFLVFDNFYAYVYLVSSILLIPAYYLIKRVKKLDTRRIEHVNVRQTISEYIKNKDLYNIFVSNFLLQFFYAYMIVYTPIYLSKFIGFSWAQIGIIFTIMLLPFVFVELPVGELEDRTYGEKEFLTIGFIITGLSTLFLSFLIVKVVWMWAVILFITRLGASTVEVSAESYFFKHVNQEKAGVISLFRAARPISFIAAPILVTLSLQFVHFQYLFIIIGSLMVLGAHYSLALTDTK